MLKTPSKAILVNEPNGTLISS